MAKLEINETERQLIVGAINKARASAKRQQASSDTPQIIEVYAAKERNLIAIQMKIADAK